MVRLVVELPQMQFTDKVFAILFAAHGQFPMVLVVQKLWRFRSCYSPSRSSWRRSRYRWFGC